MFQDYALFPHMTVQQNVEYGLRVKRVPKQQRRERALEALKTVRLEDYGSRKPSQLSGGQRQRVALARALVNRPKVLLLDEPLGALDLKLRQAMQLELKQIQRDVGITFVFVTHDQDEALTMSDRIAVFNDGKIEQVGPPEEVYERPASAFVAGFVGTSNLLGGRGAESVIGRPGLFSIRPEKIRIDDELSEPAAAGETTATGTVTDVVYAGATVRYAVALDAAWPTFGRPAEHRRRVGGRPRPAELAPRTQLPSGGFAMKNRKTRLAGIVGASLLLAACGTSGTSASAPPGAQGFTPPKLEALKALGQPEGQLNVLAWPGYAENGSNDPKINWVTPFEQQTGCKVNVKPFGTSDEAVTLMKTGQYDVVSASGDASLRLVASGDVEPVNTALVPNYTDVQPFLKDKSWNSVAGVAYGIPHGWGANLLTWRTDKVTAGAELVVGDVRGELAVQGQGDRVRLADLHRRRRAVPDGAPAGPGHQEPVRPRRQAVRRRRGPAQAAAAAGERVLVGLPQGVAGAEER